MQKSTLSSLLSNPLSMCGYGQPLKDNSNVVGSKILQQNGKNHSPHKVDSILIGNAEILDRLHQPLNFTFQQLDTTILPVFLQPFKCSCEKQLEPCSKIMQIVKGQHDLMKKEHEQTKQRLQNVQIYKCWQRVGKLLPKSFPQALQPTLQNLVRQTLADDSDSFGHLAHVTSHCKLQYLAYWLYRQLTPLRQDQQLQLSYVYLLCHKLSQLILTVIGQHRIQFEQQARSYFRSLGASLIPVERYAQYLNRLSKHGRRYSARVLFCYLLLHKDKLQQQSYLQLRYEGAETCWNKVFTAAQNVLLLI